MFSSNTSQVSSSANYIEDFFSAWLRTGTGSSQTVTTGIEEDTGALVISKSRSAATDWAWYDTFRGATKDLVSNSTAAQTTQSQGLTSFNSNGHTWGTLAKVNTSGATYVDFVLKPQPKFFDVVTGTTDSSGNCSFSHSLASEPGCVILKFLNDADNCVVYHRGMNGGTTPKRFWNFLNLTNAQNSQASDWISLSSTTVSTSGGFLYWQNKPFVAYLFAHNAGGFGLTGTDNVISCGGGIQDGAVVNLGYEPQWVMFKRTDSSTGGNWFIVDTMRGQTAPGGNGVALFANTAGAEVSGENRCLPNATGFTFNGPNGAPATYIYIAIRRGPMKTPTSGTSVYNAIARTGTGSAGFNSTSILSDFVITKAKNGVFDPLAYQRLTDDKILYPSRTDAEQSAAALVPAQAWDNMTGVDIGTSNAINGWSYTYVDWAFRRAPGFFDVVCYSGNSTQTAYNHNLGVAPQLVIVKVRNTAGEDWPVWSIYGTQRNGYACILNGTNAYASRGQNMWGDDPDPPAAPSMTATTFRVGNNTNVNETGKTYVAYLFASCPGVSKVGSYTGTGTTQQINCGFTAGARFVLIKATSTTGDWLVWDSARGIVAGNDPYLALNSTAAEVTTTDWVDPYSAGFELSNASGNLANTNGVSYIFFAVA